jgi:hypothetical protein
MRRTERGGRWSVWIVAAVLAAGVPGAVAAHDEHEAPAMDFEAVASDGPAYPVSGIKLQITSSTPEARALVELPELKLALGQVQNGFVAPRDGVPVASVRLMVAPYSNYYASAIQSIGMQISEHLEDEGFENVLVYPLEEEIDPETGRDLRGTGQVNLTLLVRAEPRKKRGWFR